MIALGTVFRMRKWHPSSHSRGIVKVVEQDVPPPPPITVGRRVIRSFEDDAPFHRVEGIDGYTPPQPVLSEDALRSLWEEQ